MRALLLLIVLATAAPSANAQILRTIQRKAADAVAQKAEAKLDAKIEAMAEKAVNGSYDALFGGIEAGAQGAAGSRSPFTLGANATTEERYSFSLVSVMDIEMFKKNGKSEGKSQIISHFNPTEAYSGVRVTGEDMQKDGAESFVIFDVKNKAMVMLMQSEGNKFSAAYSWKDALAAAPVTDAPTDWETAESWRTWTRIGTKSIAGYTATGYRSADAEHTTEIWVSRDPALANTGLFAASGSLKSMRGRVPAEYPVGMLMALTSTETKSGDKVVMTVTSVDTKAKVSYRMADYPRMGAPAK